MAETKVMVVDDDEHFLEELGELLALGGYKVFYTGDPMAAVSLAASVCPDVALIDLKMPGKTGFQLANELRCLPGLEDMRVIGMSGFVKDGYRCLLDMCGIGECLKKPFKPLDIIAAIENSMTEE